MRNVDYYFVFLYARCVSILEGAMKRIKYYARRRADGEEWESAVISAEYFAALTGRRVCGDVELFSGNAMTERKEYIASSGGEFLGVYRLEKIF